MTSTDAAKTFVNPYAGHRLLNETEQQLLGEFARLAGTIKRITALSAPLASSNMHQDLLTELRVLERKMGLVLTLFKASVWALIQEQQDEMEAQQQREEEAQRYAEDAAMYGQNGDDTVTDWHSNQASQLGRFSLATSHQGGY